MYCRGSFESYSQQTKNSVLPCLSASSRKQKSVIIKEVDKFLRSCFPCT